MKNPTPTLNTASKTRRFFNSIIDMACCLLLASILLIARARFNEPMYNNLNRSLWEFFVGVAFLVYYIPLEYFFGKTLGKLITQTKVVTIQGEKLTLLQTIGRTLCRLLPFEPLSFFGKNAEGWHDTLSKTRVVH